MKIRAWDKQHKLMIPFDELWICDEYSSLAFESSKYRGIGNLPGSYQHDIDDVESVYDLMYSTGLKDKNGVEVCQGDILTNGRFNMVMVYNKDDASFDLSDGEARLAREEAYSFKHTLAELTVIGNIYENPELLDRKEENVE